MSRFLTSIKVGVASFIIIAFLISGLQISPEENYQMGDHIYAPNHVVYGNGSSSLLESLTDFDNIWPKPAMIFSNNGLNDEISVLELASAQVQQIEPTNNLSNISVCQVKVVKTGFYELYLYAKPEYTFGETSYLVQFNGRKSVVRLGNVGQNEAWIRVWNGQLNEGLYEVEASEITQRGGLGEFSLSFNGAGDFVRVPFSESLKLTDFSVELWISTPTPVKHLQDQFLLINGASKYNYVMVLGHDFRPGAVMWAVHDDEKQWETWSFAPSTYILSPDAFYHLIGVFNSSSGKGDLYVNGAWAGELVAPKPLQTNTGPLEIGGSPTWFVNLGWPEFSYEGLIDEVRIYNRSLSTAEVENNYVNPYDSVKNGLVMRLSMDEGSGNMTYDLSGLKNDGIIHGAKWIPVVTETKAPEESIILYTNITLSSPNIEYVKDNPARYRLKVEAEGPFILVFSETFDKGWVPYYGEPNWVEAFYTERIPENNHFLVNGYANGWYINKTGSTMITLYFWPQSVYYLGMATSLGTIGACITYLLNPRITHTRNRQRDMTGTKLPKKNI